MTASPDMMDEMDSMYGESESESPPASQPEKEEGEEEETGNTAIVPTSLLKGAKEGDTITLKVVKVYDGDEAEVALASEDKESPASDDEQIEALDEKE